MDKNIYLTLQSEFTKKRREICDYDAQRPNKRRELKMMTERMEDQNFRKLRLMKERALTWQDIQVCYLIWTVFNSISLFEYLNNSVKIYYERYL